MQVGSAAEDSDKEGVDGAANRKRLMDVHTKMLGTLAVLPGSLLLLSRSMEGSGLQPDTRFHAQLGAQPFQNGSGGQLHKKTLVDLAVMQPMSQLPLQPRQKVTNV